MRYSKKIQTEIYKILATTNCDVTKLCKLISIDRSTYYKWYNSNEEFQKLIKKSRAEFRSSKRDNVISSLYKRAMGYMVTEVRETIKVNSEGEQIEKKIVTHKKYIRPSEKAIKYFLENFDEQGYELFSDTDNDDDDDDDDDIEYEDEDEEVDNDDDDDDDDDEEEISTDEDNNIEYDEIETIRQKQVDSINLQIESESQSEIIEPEFDLIKHILNPKVTPENELEKRGIYRDYQEVVDETTKLRKAVAFVISPSSGHTRCDPRQKDKKKLKRQLKNHQSSTLII